MNVMRHILTRSKMICDMVALASTMMVAVLSSRISFRRGVGSWLSSNMRTDRVSLEIRNCLSSCSKFNKPVGEIYRKHIWGSYVWRWQIFKHFKHCLISSVMFLLFCAMFQIYYLFHSFYSYLLQPAFLHWQWQLFFQLTSLKSA